MKPVALYRSAEASAAPLALLGFGMQPARQPVADRALQSHAAVFVDAGTGMLQSTRAGQCPVSAPALFWLFPGEVHSYGPDAGTVWHERWILFDGPLARALEKAGLMKPAAPVVALADAIGIARLFAALHSDSLDASPLAAHSAGANVHRLIVEVARQSQQAEAPGPAIAMVRIAEALRLRAFEPLDLDAVDCELLALAEGSVDIVGSRARQKGLQLMCHVDPALPRMVTADPVRLRQVLLNLVGNAIKFTRSGEVRLVLTQLRRHGETCTVRFEVADTGIGIDPAKITALFTPFTQADNSVTREYGGTGLGLSISKSLVELMGGSISVDSTPGAGAVFRFDLLLPAVGTDFSLPAPAPEGTRVLLVEPNGRQAAILASCLRAAGVQVTLAACAAEALALAWQSHVRPSVVFAARLPDSEPDAFATAMMARVPQVRLVFLASHEDDRDDAASLGFHAVLLQPFRQAALLEAIAVPRNEADFVEFQLERLAVVGLPGEGADNRFSEGALARFQGDRSGDGLFQMTLNGVRYENPFKRSGDRSGQRAGR